MSTFYLMPPRPNFGESVEHFLQSWLPGMAVPREIGSAIAAALQAGLEQKSDTFLVFREDMPDGSDPATALRDGFGAEDGDRIVELRLVGTGGVVSRAWTLDGMSVARAG